MLRIGAVAQVTMYIMLKGKFYVSAISIPNDSSFLYREGAPGPSLSVYLYSWIG